MPPSVPREAPSVQSAKAVPPILLAACHAGVFPKAWSAETFAGFLADENTIAFAACRDPDPASPSDPPAGFIFARCAGDEAEILTLGVSPASRRSGIAGKLLSHLIAESRARRIARIFLEVGAGNREARQLYAARGFTMVGVRENYYVTPGGDTEDAHVLALDLMGPGSP